MIDSTRLCIVPRVHIFRALSASLLTLLIGVGGIAAALGPPPPTRRGDDSDTRFGVTIADPYRWLEASDSLEVQKWTQAQNKYASEYLSNATASADLSKRISELAAGPPPRSVPKIANGKIFFLQRQLAGEWPSLMETSFSSSELVVVAAPSKDESAIVDYSPTPSGRYVAVGRALSGHETLSIDIYDLETKRIRESIPESANVVSATLAWDVDEKGFYYVRAPVKSQNDAALLDRAIYHHALGTDIKIDKLSFSRGFSPLVDLRQPTAEFELIASSDSGRLALFTSIGDSTSNSVYLRRENTWRRILDESAAVREGVWAKDRLLVLASGAFPRGHVLGISPEGNVSEVLPQGDSVIQHISPCGDGFLLTRSWGFDWKIEHYSRAGKLIRVLDLPTRDIGIDGIGSAIGAASAIIAYSGWTVSPRWKRYDADSGSLRPLFEMKADGGYAGVSIHHINAVSEDSTTIPITLFSKNNRMPGEKSPTILFAYGAYGVSLRPRFLGTRLAWIERGGMYAEAIIRGGGEFGEDWREHGFKLNKIKGTQDFSAATHLLLDQNWTDIEHLGIEGQSAGGLIIGAAITQHPESYRAASGAVGVYDLLRNETFASGRFTAGEFGSISDQDEFRAMLTYSPLQHVVTGAKYPAVLFEAADMDELVAPWQSRKFAAALQNATTSTRPVLLLTRLGSGHGRSTSFSEHVDDETFVLSFFAKELGLPAGPG